MPATYGTLIDLGTIREYHGILVYNTLDSDIWMQFGDSNEVKIYAGISKSLDNFNYNGIILYKQGSVAPTDGLISLECW